MKTPKSPSREAAPASQVSARPARSRKASANLKTAPPREAKGSPLEIPPILKEGDRPEPAAAAGPGEKYSVGPASHAARTQARGRELPEAYGTGALFMAARDPHTLYAHWDLTGEQIRTLNALSVHRHLVLKIRSADRSGPPLQEIHVHPESRHWFVHVQAAETTYTAELGYYRAKDSWVTLATSRPAPTPPATESTDVSVRFTSLPATTSQGSEGASARTETLFPGWSADESPSLSAWPVSEWTPAQEQALIEMLTPAATRQDWASSEAIADLVRRQIEAGILQPFGPSSPMGDAGVRPRQFWFNINAELVVYGGTEPGASVTLAGRPIELRPDGTFSCRFALPDGQFQLVAVAVSTQQESREALLKFSRETVRTGEVGVAAGTQLELLPK